MSVEQNDQNDDVCFRVTKQNKVLRLRKRAVYNREAIHQVLKAGTLAHIGFVMEKKEKIYPVVLPMLYGVKKASKAPPNTIIENEDDNKPSDDNQKTTDDDDAEIDEEEFDVIYLHGAMNNNMLRTLQRSQRQVCVTVTLLNGLVLAKSSFHSSCNYKSVCLFGRAQEIDAEETLEALERITNHVCADRWDNSRQPSKAELKATTVVKLIVESASAKIRDTGVGDDKKDLNDPELDQIWSGIIPIHSSFGEPESDKEAKQPNELPQHIQNLIETKK